MIKAIIFIRRHCPSNGPIKPAKTGDFTPNCKMRELTFVVSPLFWVQPNSDIVPSAWRGFLKICQNIKVYPYTYFFTKSTISMASLTITIYTRLILNWTRSRSLTKYRGQDTTCAVTYRMILFKNWSSSTPPTIAKLWLSKSKAIRPSLG